MKKGEQITLTVSAEDCAKVYAVLGKVNGPASPLWRELAKKLDPTGEIYSGFIYDMRPHEVLNYAKYHEQWETLLLQNSGSRLIEFTGMLNKLKKEIDELVELYNDKL